MIGQGAGQVSFTGAGGADQDEILGFRDPLTGSQTFEDRAIQSSGMAVIDVFHTGRLSELSGFKTALEPTVFPVNPFPVDDETEALFKA